MIFGNESIAYNRYGGVDLDHLIKQLELQGGLVL
jgi:hypothetical protein